ncbi:MAG: tripartite tricarboxylate transporter substrate binding protein, partial [Pseudomonadota bacterium]
MRTLLSITRRQAQLALLSVAVAALATAFAPAAVAQAYPSRPIRFVVPYPAGGGTDIVARLIAAKMTTSMGQ